MNSGPLMNLTGLTPICQLRATERGEGKEKMQPRCNYLFSLLKKNGIPKKLMLKKYSWNKQISHKTKCQEVSNSLQTTLTHIPATPNNINRDEAVWWLNMFVDI